MKKLNMCVIILLNFLLISFNTYSQDTICIDGKGEGLVFDGICGVNAGGGVGRLLINYPEPQRSEILDYLFKPNYGAAVHSYKVEIGGDGNSTEGSEPSHMHTADDQNYTRGYQWWMMKEAKKRNPDIKLMALAWDFPAWVEDVCSQAAADYLVNYIKGAKSVHNLDIEYIGLWNETKTCNEMFKKLRKTLDANGLQKVKIMGDDQVRNWAIADSMKADPELYRVIDVATTHYPKYESTRLAKDLGKPIWSSEDGPWGDGWGYSGQQSGPLAKNLNLNYILGRMTSTHIWNIITAYYNILDIPYAGLLRAMTPWSGHYEVMSPLWVTAHTTQFAKPGWQYIDKACKLLKNGGSLVTLKKNKDYSIIVETLDALEKQNLSFRISNGLSTGKVFVWKTDSARYFEKIATIAPVNGLFSFVVDPGSLYSFTTTKGQEKGTAAGPKEVLFKLPYKDDFEQYNAGYTCVKYFIEQNGAYEVVPAGYGRTGKALRQTVSQSPIVWTYGHTAYLLGTASIIGDINWSNYSVSSDFLLEEPGYARVMGRVSRVTLDGQINGYQLYIYNNGDWKLKYSTSQAALDSGKVECGLKQWHNLKISFKDNVITCFIDNNKVSEITDNRFFAGMAGIGNFYNKGLYDNFEICPIEGIPVYSEESGNKGYFFDQIPEAPSQHVCLPLESAVKVSWDPVYGAKGYKIKFGTKKDEYTSSADVGNLTSFTVWTLKSGQQYYFVVTAYNETGESKPSGIESAIVR